MGSGAASLVGSGAGFLRGLEPSEGLTGGFTSRTVYSHGCWQKVSILGKMLAKAFAPHHMDLSKELLERSRRKREREKGAVAL